MSFAIQRLNNYYKDTEESTETRVNFVLLDASAVIVLSLITTLFLSHVFTNLPHGINSFAGSIGASLIGLVLLGDVLAELATGNSPKPQEPQIEEIPQVDQEAQKKADRRLRALENQKRLDEAPVLQLDKKKAAFIKEAVRELKAPHPNQTEEEIKKEFARAIADLKAVESSPEYQKAARTDTTMHRIMNGLFLGNMQAVKECPEHFKAVISLATLHGGHYVPTEAQAKELLASKGVQWHYVGRMFLDKVDTWHTLAHDCTFSSEEVRQIEGEDHLNDELIARDGNKYWEIHNRKKEKIESVDVHQWFEPIFKVMDQAVASNDHKVYVHCSAGASRSPTLIAAYLINRFQVTTEEAIAFLKIKRPLVDPYKGFISQLKEYELSLYPDRRIEMM